MVTECCLKVKRAGTSTNSEVLLGASAGVFKPADVTRIRTDAAAAVAAAAAAAAVDRSDDTSSQL